MADYRDSLYDQEENESEHGSQSTSGRAYRNYMTFRKTNGYLTQLQAKHTQAVRYVERCNRTGKNPIQSLRDAMKRDFEVTNDDYLPWGKA